MEMKRVFSSLMALGLASTLVACGGGGDSQETTTNDTSTDATTDTATSTEDTSDAQSTDAAASTEDAAASEEAANFESQTADDTLVIGNSEMSGDFYKGWTNNSYDVKVRRLIGTEGNNSYQTVVQDEGGAWVNNSAVLAEDPVREENEDGSKTITFKIKEDLKWSDGEAVTSDDY
ncbi:MAG: ABC transporter substrate-binding protein, partial [Anaerococcus sp.]|nr:ABC transporter substrate-binding protein [Anaerococcus sp.]